jgi:hypothetical protein
MTFLFEGGGSVADGRSKLRKLSKGFELPLSLRDILLRERDYYQLTTV